MPSRDQGHSLQHGTDANTFTAAGLQPADAAGFHATSPSRHARGKQERFESMNAPQAGYRWILQSQFRRSTFDDRRWTIDVRVENERETPNFERRTSN
jgi:hypothetical protein